MKKIITEEVHVDKNGTKHYYRVEKLVSDDEYYYRKYCESMHRTSFDKIFDSYRDYCESKNWD